MLGSSAQAQQWQAREGPVVGGWSACKLEGQGGLALEVRLMYSPRSLLQAHTHTHAAGLRASRALPKMN